MNMQQLNDKIDELIGMKYPMKFENPNNLSIEQQPQTTDNPYGLSELELDCMRIKTKYWEKYHEAKKIILQEKRSN